MKVGSLIKDALILFAITLVLGLALSVAKVVTQPAIDKAAAESQLKAFNAVCPGYSTADDLSNEFLEYKSQYKAKIRFSKDGKEAVLRAKDSSGNVIGYIIQATSKGFGGDLNLIIGFDIDGKITGVRYANTPSETPGVGMKTTKEDFLKKWVDKNSDDVDTVDTISGATISSTAFKEAMKLACDVCDEAKII